jgi:hypothetical protein
MAIVQLTRPTPSGLPWSPEKSLPLSPSPPLPECLAGHRRRTALLYRTRAAEALALARQALAADRTLAAAGYLSEADFWRVAARSHTQLAGGAS